MLTDSSETPRSAAWNSSGVFSVSSATVLSDSASWSVSMRSERSASPEKASTTSYGDVVRAIGISASSASWPPPSGCRERYIAPSRVFTLIAAAVC